MRYPHAFEAWWNENKNSEYLIENYKNYRVDIACADQKPLSYKRWALNFYQED